MEKEKMKSLYRGGMTLLIGFISIKIGGLLFRFICMRYLPVDVYGEVAVFLVIFNWLLLFSTLNMTIGMAKFIAGDQKKRGAYFTSCLLGSLVIALLFGSLFVLFSPWISSALKVQMPAMYWVAIGVPFSVIHSFGNFYFRSLFRMKSSAFLDLFMVAIRVALLALLLVYSFSQAPYMAFVASFIVADLYVIYRIRIDTRMKFSEMKSVFRNVLFYSFPIFLGEFLSSFSMGIDRILIAGFYSTTEAGFYDVGVALCLGYMLIASSYANALLPLASSSDRSPEKRKKQLFRALKASTLLFAIYTAVLLVLAKSVIEFVNPVYLGVLDFLPQLMASYISIGYLVIMFFYVNSTGRQRLAFYAAALFAFLNTALNLYLTPTMLYAGAAGALVSSSALSLVFIGVLVWKSERKPYA